MSPGMARRLSQFASTKPRNITESDIIRDAIRRFLDQQEEHFTGLNTTSKKHARRKLMEVVGA